MFEGRHCVYLCLAAAALLPVSARAQSCSSDCVATAQDVSCDVTPSGTCTIQCGADCTIVYNGSDTMTATTGRSANIFCSGAGNCAADAGQDSVALCSDTAGCQFTLGPNSTAVCGETAGCNVHCNGTCLQTCRNLAGCQTTCADGGAPTDCGGGNAVCERSCAELAAFPDAGRGPRQPLSPAELRLACGCSAGGAMGGVAALVTAFPLLLYRRRRPRA